MGFRYNTKKEPTYPATWHPHYDGMYAAWIVQPDGRGELWVSNGVKKEPRLMECANQLTEELMALAPFVKPFDGMKKGYVLEGWLTAKEEGAILDAWTQHDDWEADIQDLHFIADVMLPLAVWNAGADKKHDFLMRKATLNRMLFDARIFHADYAGHIHAQHLYHADNSTQMCFHLADATGFKSASSWRDMPDFPLLGAIVYDALTCWHAGPHNGFVQVDWNYIEDNCL